MASTSSAPPTTMLAGTVESILTPGTNPGLVRAMNVTFGALFVVLSGMVWLTGANGHVIVLLLLSMFSFGSITWFIAQIAPVEEQRRLEQIEIDKKEQKEKEEAEAAAATDEVVQETGDESKME